MRLSPLLLFLSAPLPADYQDGLDAYSQGDYRRAMREWVAVTGQVPTAVNPAIYAEAHYAVARLYWDGLGTTRDYYQARDWLEKAASCGHAGAMAKLGFLYTDGITVPQDFEQAFDWYRKAAGKGDVDGLYNLGVFYQNGWGTERDPTMARQYLAAASAQGDAAAEQALQALMAEDAATVTMQAGEARREAAEPVEPLPSGRGLLDPTASIPGPDSPHFQLQAESWILAQDPEHYTIQVIALSDRGKLSALLVGHEDLAPFAVYVVQAGTRPLHVLVQGVYPTVEAARAARDRFPRAINRPEKVWIRRFAKVQEVMRREAGP